jgi:4-hydroxybenzoate polyprenyltransferase
LQDITVVSQPHNIIIDDTYISQPHFCFKSTEIFNMSSQALGREVRIFWAISETKSSSTRGAANLEAVPRSTLRDQMNGRQSVQKAHEKFLSLTPVQERELVNLILLREKDFQPLLKQEIHLCAQHLTELNGLGSDLGKKWIGRFFQRYNTIILKLSRLISKARKRVVIIGGLREYYDGLSNILRHLHVGSDRIYNLDETGLQEGESLAGVVGGTVLTTSSEKIKSNATSWISILETICATGQRVTPCVVYTGKTTQGQNFPEFIEDWKYTCSGTGWSNTEILLRWFYDIFVLETKLSDDALWRTLVLDQHKTHITAAFMKKAYMNKVWLSWLPSHSSHITQPLDLAIFGPLKRYYRQQTSAMETYEATSNRQKQIFMEA